MMRKSSPRGSAASAVFALASTASWAMQAGASPTFLWNSMHSQQIPRRAQSVTSQGQCSALIALFGFSYLYSGNADEGTR